MTLENPSERRLEGFVDTLNPPAFVNVPKASEASVSISEHLQTQIDIKNVSCNSSECVDSGFIAFMLRNNFIGEILCSSKSGFTRLARVVIFFTIFQVIIALSGIFYDVGLAWYTAGLTAAALGVLIEPILTFFLYTGKDEKDNNLKLILGFVIVCLVNGACLAGTALMADENGETYNNDWILALSVGFGVFWLVGQQICSLYKFALARNMGANF